MNPDTVKQTLEEVIKVLSPAAGKYYQLALTQVHITMAECFASAAASLLAIATAWFLYWRGDGEGYRDSDWLPAPVLITILLTIVVVFTSLNGIDLLLNPQYWALRYAVSLAK